MLYILKAIQENERIPHLSSCCFLSACGLSEFEQGETHLLRCLPQHTKTEVSLLHGQLLQDQLLSKSS